MPMPRTVFAALSTATAALAFVPFVLLYATNQQQKPAAAPVNCPTTTAILRSTDVIMSKLQEAHHASPENCLAVYNRLAAQDACMADEPDKLNQELWKKSWKDYRQICRRYPML